LARVCSALLQMQWENGTIFLLAFTLSPKQNYVFPYKMLIPTSNKMHKSPKRVAVATKSFFKL
jgi:hypothetical protein